MLPTSHLKPMNAELAYAFGEFIAASSRLENAYQQLQAEVSELRSELSDRSAELSRSVAENERMRLDLQQILDSMPCGVLVLDRNGAVTMMNPECGRLLGQEVALFPKSSQAKLRKVSTFQEGSQELCISAPSGKRWLEVRNRRLDGDGGTILILRDVTAQRRAEQERVAAREAMALAEMTSILAHEIRNPLASLELFAELIENDEDHRRQWISNLRAGIRTLSGTVNNVLSFHSSGVLKLAPISLPEVVGDAIQFVKPLAMQAGVSLDWHSSSQYRVMGNESALQQVVLNLVSNAIRHTPAAGSVSVSLKAEANRVMLEFCDTGCGIRADQMAHIFEPGFSGSGDTSGLGLAVCSRIIQQHGGEIRVANRNGRGACFVVTLPLLQKQAGAA